MRYKLSICECRVHGTLMISLDSETSGVRLTGSKCCGSWEELKTFPMEKYLLESAKEAFENALEELNSLSEENKDKVIPYPEVGLHKTSSLVGITAREISKILGFKPNVDDDTDKVKYSWGFKVNGVHCGIWDYKGSYRSKHFSCYGPKEIFDRLFGERSVK